MSRLVDDVRAIPKDGRQRLDPFGLEDHQAVSQVERVACAGVRLEVAIEVGAGQHDDEWAVGRGAAERANAVWKRLLADYQPPPTDPDIDEALKAFMERRRKEIHTAAA